MSDPNLSRRHLFRAAGAVVLAGAAAASSAAQSAAHTAAASTKSAASVVTAAARRTTVTSVVRKGSANAQGYATLVRGPGEKHLVRTGLGVKAKKGRAKRRKGVLAFAQLSDVHVLDAQSPLRVEWTDRWDDDDTPGGPIGLLSSAYRPHEMLAAHIADAMVRELNEIKVGPVTGKPLALAVQTGDNSDNAQYNEIRWNIDVLDGREVRIDSGDLTRWEGVADNDPTHYDVHYWHPDATPADKDADRPRTRYGFPTVPGLLDAARRPFDAHGLRMPWITAFGNHDGLAQGNFSTATPGLSEVATGSTKVITPPADVTKGEVLGALLTGRVTELLQKLMSSPTARTVTPDENRRLLSRQEVVEEHFVTAGTPVGHGFTAANRAQGTAYYTFDRGPRMRFVVLDSVNIAGGAEGSLDRAQLAWLKTTLKRANKDKKYVVVCSHHTSTSMDNDTGGDRVLGEEVVATLLAHRCVVAWVNGHTHTNHVWARRKKKSRRGFWEINTASHIDWPQQSRLVEIADNKDGTLSIFTTMVDHAGPVTPGTALDDTAALASIGRELAANDWHERAAARTGTRKDRNLELLLGKPH